MRFSDWSSDVCSSDLFDRLLGDRLVREHADPQLATTLDETGDATTGRFDLARGKRAMGRCLQAILAKADEVGALEIGRASCRERVWQYGSISVVDGYLKKKKRESMEE